VTNIRLFKIQKIDYYKVVEFTVKTKLKKFGSDSVIYAWFKENLKIDVNMCKLVNNKLKFMIN